MKILEAEFKTFHGPNIYSDDKVIAAKLPINQLKWNGKNQSDYLDNLKKFLNYINFTAITFFDDIQFDKAENFIKSFANKLLNVDLPSNLEIRLLTIGDNHYILIENFHIEEACISAINVALLTCFLLQNKNNEEQKKLTAKIQHSLHQYSMTCPPRVIKTMQFEAKKLNIPIYLVEPSTFLFSYGQGKNSNWFQFGCSEKDSHIGTMLQDDKLLTSKMLSALGLPSTKQVATISERECLITAKSMGYPLVIKPPKEHQGIGVSTNINNDRKLISAFRKARKHSNVVILENYIEGEDHRINVVNGQVIQITKRIIPHIIGDGKNTIKSLIERENINKLELKKKEPHYKQIPFNQELLSHLDLMGYAIQNILKPGEKLILRDVANISLGATKESIDPALMHPDNHEMATEIANYFRLDSIGIDFITTDISKSWREAGTIIEINTHPFINESMSHDFMKASFSDKNNGRINTCLILCEDQNFALEHFKQQSSKHNYPAFINAKMVKMGNSNKKITDDNLHNRCIAALLHPKCDYLMVQMTADEIVNNGLPIDNFTQCIVDEKKKYEKFVFKEPKLGKKSNSSIIEWLQKYCVSIC
ncbi:hypothetical protein [Pseudemcibacter aquimaris]|uniref:hypothetical protein n=1 Tax=Pseudemcibacter aquimaris TaxID=2857064 RepID=UPI002012BE6F|nr:hypothetical protein [Pseudemcibacter aquimaris]MCC3861148.1 hypothetical protein [Pseudemcibacter aquimaris]WDU59965.1 hypothetical protein KW060_06810 [Pseudemcibacter aquimaris]